MPRYFAKLDENKNVETVIVAESLEWCIERLGGHWVETINDPESKNFASKGYKYDETKVDFIAPKPYDSWRLNEKNRWEPPIEYPKQAVDKYFSWDEAKKNWEDKTAEVIEFIKDREVSEEIIN